MGNWAKLLSTVINQWQGSKSNIMGRYINKRKPQNTKLPFHLTWQALRRTKHNSLHVAWQLNTSHCVPIVVLSSKVSLSSYLSFKATVCTRANTHRREAWLDLQFKTAQGQNSQQQVGEVSLTENTPFVQSDQKPAPERYINKHDCAYTRVYFSIVTVSSLPRLKATLTIFYLKALHTSQTWSY